MVGFMPGGSLARLGSMASNGSTSLAIYENQQGGILEFRNGFAGDYKKP